MRLRRISHRVFGYFFPGFQVDEKMKCPFCGQPMAFRVARNGFDARIYIGRCENMTCQFSGDAGYLVERWTCLSQARASEILHMFDSVATDGEITEKIEKLTEEEAQERRRTFLA
jgi:hypothetical protein